MFPDDEDPDDFDAAGPLLPPEDRVWRHPAEVAAERRAAMAVTAEAHSRRRRLVGAGVTALTLIGGGLVIAGLVFTLGAVSSPADETVTGEGGVSPVGRSLAVPDTSWSEALLAAVDDGTPLVIVTEGDGTTTIGGGLVFDRGHVLTSATLVGDGGGITVTAGRFSRPGLLIGVDPLLDLAVLAVDDVFDVADLGFGDNVRLGQYAIVHDASTESLRLDGRVLSLATSVDHADTRMHGLIGYSSPDGPVLAGAAVFDADGRVFGVTTGAVSAPGNSDAFAVPLELAVRVATSLVDYGTPDHPWLGIQGADADEERLAGLDIEGGVVVLHVFSDGPADRAGLAPGDVLTAVAGQEVAAMSELVVAMRHTGPDAPVTVDFVRDGVARTVEVTLGHRSTASLGDDGAPPGQD